MENLFEAPGLQMLHEMIRGRVLLAFDFDGTLAPIVPKPEDASLSPRTLTLLRSLALSYPCAVISGRAQEDIARRMSGISHIQVIGNHGMSPLRQMEEFVLQVRTALAHLRPHLARVRGVRIEDKQYSLAVHYRQADDPHEAESRIERALSMLDGFRILRGHSVVNILPEGSPHKGLAVLDVRDHMSCDRILYVGDDTTDEDVFVLSPVEKLMTIRVGAPTDVTHAHYFLEAQKDIDSLLLRLLELRPPQGLGVARA